MTVTSEEVLVQASADSGEAERVARHAERPGFRISEIRMSPTQRVPWHHHTNIQDTLYVLDGSVRITLRDPDEQIELQPGES
jgi:quercetin dioxygenase-like cupin family protein